MGEASGSFMFRSRNVSVNLIIHMNWQTLRDNSNLFFILLFFIVPFSLPIQYFVLFFTMINYNRINITVYVSLGGEKLKSV